MCDSFILKRSKVHVGCQLMNTAPLLSWLGPGRESKIINETSIIKKGHPPLHFRYAEVWWCKSFVALQKEIDIFPLAWI